MIDDRVAEFARRINEADGPKGVVYVAGGGSEVFPILLAAGGGSSTLLSGRIPYDPQEFKMTLGYDPGRLVDERAARGLAMAAFRHALKIRGEDTATRVFGLGSTSKLSRGEGEREGRTHEVHAALQTASTTVVQSIRFPPELDRAWEERINALILLNLLARGKGLDALIPLEHGDLVLEESAQSERSAQLEFFGSGGLRDVLSGSRRWVGIELSGGRIRGMTSEMPLLLLSGSFRPLHVGHRLMAESASREVGVPCAFEISLIHPDKPPLDPLALRSRFEGFGERKSRIYLSDAPTYLDKAKLFPNCTFAVGHDTLLRILDPAYYGSLESRDDMLQELESLGAKFIVFGRVDPTGKFTNFLPASHRDRVDEILTRIIKPISEQTFRMDLSSSQVRKFTCFEFD